MLLEVTLSSITPILTSCFSTNFLLPKNTNPHCKHIKAEKNAIVKKADRKMLMKLKSPSLNADALMESIKHVNWIALSSWWINSYKIATFKSWRCKIKDKKTACIIKEYFVQKISSFFLIKSFLESKIHKKPIVKRLRSM